MKLTTDMKLCISLITRSFHDNRTSKVTITNDHLQCSTLNSTVVFGLHSLRLTIVNNIDNTAMCITPCNVQDEHGVYLHHMGTSYFIFNEEKGVQKDFNTLCVDGGELFQMGTLYQCDFTDTSEVLPLFLDLIKNLGSFTGRYNKSLKAQAIQNISEAIEYYENAVS